MPDMLALMAAAAAFLSVATVLIALALPSQKRSPFEARLDRLRDDTVIRPGDDPASVKTSARNRRRMLEERLRSLDAKRSGQGSKKKPLSEMLDHAGLDWSPRQFLMISAMLGLVGIIGFMLLGFSMLAATTLGFGAGAALPRLWLQRRRSRRQALFADQFADALDVMARGLKAGLPVNETLKMIAEESPDPVAEEFTKVMRTQGVGLTLEQALSRLQERMPITEVTFFTTALEIQRQTGGNLSDTLGNLSAVLRGRKQLKGKVGALSAEGRISAMIIGALPFLVLGGTAAMSPDYVAPLFTTLPGQIMLAGGGLWMGIGIALMLKMIAIKV